MTFCLGALRLRGSAAARSRRRSRNSYCKLCGHLVKCFLLSSKKERGVYEIYFCSSVGDVVVVFKFVYIKCPPGDVNGHQGFAADAMSHGYGQARLIYFYMDIIIQNKGENTLSHSFPYDHVRV